MGAITVIGDLRTAVMSGLRPGLIAMHRREWGLLRGDFVAGLTVAAYLVPQVLAYSTVAGMPPITGLWAAIAALGAYAVVGSSRLLSIGPDSTTAVLTATSIAPLAVGDPIRYAVLASLLALLVGGVCLVGWIARLGFLAELLSRPVLVGYLAGIALIMIVGQLKNVTGVPTSGSQFVSEISSFLGHLDNIHWPTVLLSTAVLGFLIVVRSYFPRIPGPLIAVLLASMAVAVLSLRQRGVAVVGPVPAGLPAVGFPIVSFADLRGLIPAAFGVAIVAYSDTILTGRAFASHSGQHLDANHEMLALGVSNIGAGLFRGFPVTSSGSRTAISESAGGRSQLYSLVALASVVAVLFVGGSLVASFPTAALGALVIYAAFSLIDVADLRRFGRFRTSELVLALGTTLGVLVLGVLGGVVAAIAVSSLDLLRKFARPPAAVLGFVPNLPGMHGIDDYPEAATIPGLVVYRYDAPLCFGNSADFRSGALDAIDSAIPRPRWLLLNAEASVGLDYTAAQALGDLIEELHARGVALVLARAKQDLIDDLGRTGLLERIGTEHIFPTLPVAVQAFKRAAIEESSN